MFIFEGVPTILFGFVFLLFIPDKPSEAKWLKSEEREYLQDVIDKERAVVAKTHDSSWLKALRNPKVLILSVIYIASVATSQGLIFFLPQILKRMGLATMEIGWMMAISYAFGTIGLLLFAYVSDKKNERKWCVIAALGCTALGFIGIGVFSSSVLLVIILASLCAFGNSGIKSPFWALPPIFLVGPAAAAGVAFINSVGNIGGFVGPYALGWLREATGAFESGLYFLAGLAIAAAIATVLLVNMEKEAAKATLEK